MKIGSQRKTKKKMKVQAITFYKPKMKAQSWSIHNILFALFYVAFIFFKEMQVNLVSMKGKH